MEGGKKSGSSLASDLFGAKDPSQQTSSVGIFPPPPKVSGREPFQCSETEKKIASENPTWTSKNGVSGGLEGQAQSTAGKDKVLPFHYNSSIYYGGRDDYTPSEIAQESETTINKDGGEDHSDSSSIRSWWQGSVYY